jgi:excisionase family DNA binding protein
MQIDQYYIAAERMTAMIEEMLTAEEVAGVMKWKLATVYQKKYRREIEFVKIGRSLRFKKSSLLKLIDLGTVPARRTA